MEECKSSFYLGCSECVDELAGKWVRAAAEPSEEKVYGPHHQQSPTFDDSVRWRPAARVRGACIEGMKSFSLFFP